MGAGVPITSRPSLARPSTTLPQSAPPVVDGRHKHALGRAAGPARGAGHDTRGTIPPPDHYFNAQLMGDYPAVVNRYWSPNDPANAVIRASYVTSGQDCSIAVAISRRSPGSRC